MYVLCNTTTPLAFPAVKKCLQLTWVYGGPVLSLQTLSPGGLISEGLRWKYAQKASELLLTQQQFSTALSVPSVCYRKVY